MNHRMHWPWRAPITVCMIAGIVLSLAFLARPASPQPAVDTRVYTLSVTGAELQSIGGALNERPYREVAPLLQKLQQQVAAQDAEYQKKAAPTPPAK